MSDPLKQTSYLLKAGDSEAAKRANEKVLNDLETVMSTRQGRRFIWRLMGKSNLKENAMTGNSFTYFLLGQQSVSNELIDILFTERFIPLFRRMQDEALEDQKVTDNSKQEKKDV
jgi:hypothetical protein